MKKVGVFITLLLMISFTTTVLAAEGDSCAVNEDCEIGQICEDEECILETTSTTTAQQDPDKTEKAFECLETKAKDCKSLTTQELAYTILATPDNIFDDCLKELKSRKISDNWGNSVRDTALAILALDHAGENTEASEKWLLKQSRTPTDLIWYLQQDSNTETECHIGYQTKDYLIAVEKNKKIDRNAGTCLTLAQSNFWLQINPTCYDYEFSISCDKDFIATLLYKNKNSPVIYPLQGTDSSPAYGTIDLNVNSKCFGKTSCEYEATAWATLALLKKGYDIEEYIPYIIAMADSNERYLPNSFTYMATNYENYATQLIEQQKLGNYWEAQTSAYNRYYDTALALIAIGGSSSEQITKARDWLLFSQGSNGCWSNSIRDTAIVLWALEGRAGKAGTGGSTTYCSQANYFCIPSSECPSSEDVGNNYFCPSLSETCCITENLQSCSAYGGTQCGSDKACTNERRATDTETCCVGECVEKPKTNECEDMYYSCRDSCSENQEEVTVYSCDGTEVCCKNKTASSSGGSAWWIWILIILILTVLVAIGYIYREKLKLYWFKLKSKFKKDKGGKGSSSPGPSFPPRPGFPPIRRPQGIPERRSPRRMFDRRDQAMAETFRKLKEMSS